jgi:hypothetical protein
VARSTSLDLLDRLAVLYVVLPLPIFLFGWLEIWAAVPLALCMAYSLTPLAASLPGKPWPVSGTHLAVAATVGCAWTACGGTGHLVFANPDWHLRDAVLHDLVTGRWPVGYGVGADRLLRAPIGYYLPAALIGKAAGLLAAHAALAAWTAAGVVLFLVQVLSPTAPQPAGTSGAAGARELVNARRPVSAVGLVSALGAAAVIVLFSGLDVIGTWLQAPGSLVHTLAHWDVTRHLEWWAESYQYSSMTTQLFWVPNHALGGWLVIGLLMRERGAHDTQRGDLETVLPLVVVALALWSPLTALGAAPFVLCRMCDTVRRDGSLAFANPRIWAPALAVGLVLAAYLTLDAGRIPRAWTIGRHGLDAGTVARDLWRHAEFFLLEAGLIGAAILAIRASRRVVLALAILALLPLVSFGAANDFVMRVSIPSLAVLAIAACGALAEAAPNAPARVKRGALAGLLVLGAVTPLQEFARAAVLEPWPINPNATLVGAACGSYPPQYVAHLHGQWLTQVMRPPHALPLGSLDAASCVNPALRIEKSRGLR